MTTSNAKTEITSDFLRAKLKEYFHHKDFKSTLQKDAIKEIIKGMCSSMVFNLFYELVHCSAGIISNDSIINDIFRKKVAEFFEILF